MGGASGAPRCFFSKPNALSPITNAADSLSIKLNESLTVIKLGEIFQYSAKITFSNITDVFESISKYIFLTLLIGVFEYTQTVSTEPDDPIQ